MAQIVSLDVLGENERQAKFDPNSAVEKSKRKQNIDEENLKDSEEVAMSYWSFFYVLLIVIICSFSSFAITLIPQHNAIEQGKYWYETIIDQALAHNIWVTTITVMRIRIFFKDVDCLRTSKSILKLYPPPGGEWL